MRTVLNSLLKYPNQPEKREELNRLSKTSDFHKSKQLVAFLQEVMISNIYSPLSKLHALCLLDESMHSSNTYILSEVSNELLPWFAELLAIPEDSFIFEDPSKIQQEASRDFRFSLLKNIEQWAEEFKYDGLYSFFYNDLKKKGISFKVAPKLAYQEIKQNIREVILSLDSSNSSSVDPLVRSLNTQKAKLEKLAVKQVESGKNMNELLNVIDMLNECFEMYEKAQNSDEVLRSMDNEEHHPKILIVSERYDSMVNSEDETKYPSEDPIRVSNMDFNNYNLIDKLDEWEDLAQMYKADLMSMQANYLKVVEQKEEIRIALQECKRKQEKMIDKMNGVQLANDKAREIENPLGFEQCVITNSGILFEDTQVIISISINNEGNLCVARLGISKRQNVQLKLEIEHVPDGLTLLHDLDTFESTTSEFVVSIAARFNNSFFGFPILNLKYSSKNCKNQKFLGIPITQCVFFSKDEMIAPAEWEKLADYSVVFGKTGDFRNQNIDDLVRRKVINDGFFVEIIDAASGIGYSYYKGLPVLFKVLKANEEVRIEIRCKDEIVSSNLMKLMNSLLNGFSNY